MPGRTFAVPIETIVDLLGLERSPKNRPGARSIKVHCPFCNHRGYTMDVDTSLDVYHCFHCPEEMQKKTGALDLYSRVRLGEPLDSRNSKEAFKKLLAELDNNGQNTVKTDISAYRDDNIYPASDESLNLAYSALFSLPYLRISRNHIEDLAKRGLPEWAARRGQFASLPPAYQLVKNHPRGQEMLAWYDANSVGMIRERSPILSRYQKRDIVAGVLIAEDLARQGVKLSGVPGFYHITPEVWAFRYDSGLMIPTVSYEGNIVGVQTRKDTAMKSGLRYMTLSSKGLPDGVTARISRTHVCHSRKINENTQVYITEGPLKADMILWFLTGEYCSDVAVVAVQGVKNVKEIPEIARKLKKDGVKRVFSAFDMDKCCNIAVSEASQEIKRLFNEEEISVDTLCWDVEFAYIKRKELVQLAKENGLKVMKTGNPYFDIANISKTLARNNIEYNVRYENGKKYKDHWRSETKGLDDFLFQLANKQ